jgi:hypothetical protein
MTDVGPASLSDLELVLCGILVLPHYTLLRSVSQCSSR